MKNEKWINNYYAFIEKLKETRPVGTYNKLDIKKYYTNERVETFGWLYNKHHIDEINISGANLMNMPEYSTGDVIIVDFLEHYLLHYMIVLAKTTSPNHGMILPMIRGGMSVSDAIMEWDELVVEACEKYNIEYVSDWDKNLTINHNSL